eukprot:225951_1
MALLHRILKHRITSFNCRMFSTQYNNMERTKTIENGSKIDNGIFSDTEMHRRLSNTHKIMHEDNIDFALFTSYHNICYLTQFLYCKFGRKYALIIDKNTSSNMHLIAANIDGGYPWRKSPQNCKVTSYTDWSKDNYFFAIQQILDQNQLTKSFKIGIEFDDISLAAMNQLKDHFSINNYNLEFIDISNNMMKSRMIKSKEEHELIRCGACIADFGGYAAANAIQNGINTEHEIAMQSTNTMINQIAMAYEGDEYIDLQDTWTWFQSGINTDGAHNPTTSKQLQHGDILSLNCFPMINGYYTALERTLFYNEIPSKQYLKLWEINCKVHKRGSELIQPGAKCSDIANELNEIYIEYDLLKYRTFGYGHSFGVLCHYYGRESGLELREDNHTVIENGMVISMEPCFTIPENVDGSGGYREHDILIVHENDAENITKFPFGPDNNVIQSTKQ